MKDAKGELSLVGNRLATLYRQPVQARLQYVRELRDSSAVFADFQLLCLADDVSYQVRSMAIEALGFRGGTMARIAARAGITDFNKEVRRVSAVCLGICGESVDVSRLQSALRDKHWVVRSDAALSLGRLGGKSSRKSLQQLLLRDKEVCVRRDAAIALATLEDTAAVPVLRQTLGQEKENLVRAGLLYALYKLERDPDALDALLLLLDADDFLVRNNVINMIYVNDLTRGGQERVRQAVTHLLDREQHTGVSGDAEVLLHELNNALA